MKEKIQKLNDGYIGVYRPKSRKTDFSAKVSAKTMNDLEYFVDMAYSEQYKREQDFDFAESSGHSLSLKVKTLLYEEITKEYKVILDNVLYNILKIDYAKTERAMYFYLEEERKLAE